MDTMTTETAPVEETTPATDAAKGSEGEGGGGEAEAGEAAGETEGETVETLRAKLAEATNEADRAKRFIVNYVSERSTERRDPESMPDTFASAGPGDVIEEFKENPIGLLDKHFATRMAPIVADNLEARAKDNRTNAIQRLGADMWNEYGEEIDKFMHNMSIHTRANPGSYEEALHFVRARNIDKEIEKGIKAKMKAIEDEKRSSVEGSGMRSGGSPNGRSAPAMSDVEKSIAKGFGMSEKEWMRYKTPRERR